MIHRKPAVPDLADMAQFRLEAEQWPTQDIGRAIAEVRPAVEAGTASLQTWMENNVLCQVLSERKQGRAA